MVWKVGLAGFLGLSLITLGGALPVIRGPFRTWVLSCVTQSGSRITFNLCHALLLHSREEREMCFLILETLLHNKVNMVKSIHRSYLTCPLQVPWAWQCESSPLFVFLRLLYVFARAAVFWHGRAAEVTRFSRWGKHIRKLRLNSESTHHSGIADTNEGRGKRLRHLNKTNCTRCLCLMGQSNLFATGVLHASPPIVFLLFF